MEGVFPAASVAGASLPAAAMEVGEGADTLDWNINTVDVQDFSIQLPFADVTAVDDPYDPLPPDEDASCLHWTAADVPGGTNLPPDSVPDPDPFDDRPRAQMDDAAQVT
jgi:hypothetical protein